MYFLLIIPDIAGYFECQNICLNVGRLVKEPFHHVFTDRRLRNAQFFCDPFEFHILAGGNIKENSSSVYFIRLTLVHIAPRCQMVLFVTRIPLKILKLNIDKCILAKYSYNSKNIYVLISLYAVRRVGSVVNVGESIIKIVMLIRGK